MGRKGAHHRKGSTKRSKKTEVKERGGDEKEGE